MIIIRRPQVDAVTVLKIVFLAPLVFISFTLFSQDKPDSELVANELKKGEKYIIKFIKVPERLPQYTLKTERMIYTDNDIAMARKNVQLFPGAKKVREGTVNAANKWLDWSDERLRDLLTDGSVPRGFDLSSKGCPVHGNEIFSKGGTYPWIVNPEHQFQVKCPVGEEIYPSNDFEAYYKSDYKDKKNLDAAYTDDGWGWVAPDGERYWFVAYANHWIWMNHIIPAITDLSQAYLLTGDNRYSHKAGVMLYRMAEVYPSMDHNTQSRYGFNTRVKGGAYHGKIVNLIWETMLIQQAAEAYDMIWDSIDGDLELQKLYNKDGKGVRSFIEANLLEDALDAYLQQKIQGNYGMHQTALLYLLLARQNMDTKKYHHMIVEEEGQSRVQTGVRYALYNMIFRDGIPLESPSYNMLTVDRLATMGELLYKGGTSLFTEPRLKMVFDRPIDMVAIRRFTPDIGDSGSVLGGIQGKNDNVYQIAYAMYKDPKYLNWLRSMNKTGANSFSSFGSLFRKATDESEGKGTDESGLATQPSRLYAGYGLGILANRNDKSSVSFNYGFKGTHYHWDFLNFELFANGRKMMPDMGYPDAMNEYVKEVYTWSTHTVSHNTVMVDAQRQRNNVPGDLHDYADSPFARSMDASSQAYTQTSDYRRNLVMVDINDSQSYLVDFFRVSGGRQHDYSLHGPPGSVISPDSKWSEKQIGTLAGPSIKIGQIYDNDRLGAEAYTGEYGSYTGSGFQNLFNVQHLEKGNGLLEYAHTSDATARLRIHLLPVDKQEVYMADAYDKPRAKNHTVKFLLARRNAAGPDTLRSTFTGIMEPYDTEPYVLTSSILEVKGGSRSAAVEVHRQHVTDVIVSDTENAVKYIEKYGIVTDANTAVLTMGKKGELIRVFFSNGTYLKYKSKSFKAAGLQGEIASIDFKKQVVKVKLNGNEDLNSMQGRAVHFTNPFRTTVHPLGEISGKGRVLDFKMSDDLLVGRLRVSASDGQLITTKTNLPFAPVYTGATLLNDQKEEVGLISKAPDRIGRIKLANQPLKELKIGEDAWISNIGIGEKVLIKPVFFWSAKAGK